MTAKEIRKLRTIKVTEKQAVRLARSAARLRWNPAEYRVDASCLIQPRCPEHTAFTAFNVYRCILYNLLEGGEYTTTKLNPVQNSPVRKVRRLTHAGEMARITTGLWSLTKNWAESL
jgi:hypothetical protein